MMFSILFLICVLFHVFSRCFSIVAGPVSLHLEATSKAQRDSWFVCICELLQHVHESTATLASTPSSSFSLPSATPDFIAFPSSVALSTLNGTSASPTTSQTLANSSQNGFLNVNALNESVQSTSLLETGTRFTVFVLDKNDASSCSKHEVVLWYQAGSSRPPVC